MGTTTLEQLAKQIGETIHVSDWHEVSQPMINGFADVTGDHQFIHVDAERASQGPFGGTIAHGFLTLSLMAAMFNARMDQVEGISAGVNYGFDRVRLLSPVKSGARVRGRFVLRDFAERGQGQVLMTLAATVEIEGESRPALAADWLVLLMRA